MRLTPDDKRRVVLPLPIQKGDILLLDEQGENRWLLTRIERRERVSPRKLRGKSVADALAGSAQDQTCASPSLRESRSARSNCDLSDLKFESNPDLRPRSFQLPDGLTWSRRGWGVGMISE